MHEYLELDTMVKRGSCYLSFKHHTTKVKNKTTKDGMSTIIKMRR